MRDAKQPCESSKMSLSIHKPASSSPSLSGTSWTYDVYLSFRGQDTRWNFIGHLSYALVRKGVSVFKDDKKLERGQSIHEEFFESIKESRHAIVVISKNYASSIWCLSELNEIMKCRRETGLTVLPVFYRVEPSDVRHQTGPFKQAFATHEKNPKVGKEHMEAWRTALKEIGSLFGWHVDKRSQVDVIRDIYRTIFDELHMNPPNLSGDLVGMEARVQKLLSLLRLEMDEVRCIGIYGVSGIGKTTLAQVIYNKIRFKFDASCFIFCTKNNRSCGIEELQQQIVYEIFKKDNTMLPNHLYGTDLLAKGLRRNRVLIVLDDVNQKQLKALAGSPSWFGHGSRIILTSRDCQFWEPLVNEVYEVGLLNEEDAFQLFCRKAFNRPEPNENSAEFETLSRKIVYFGERLPLLLEVFGSYLRGKEKSEWKSFLIRLKANSDKDVVQKLKITFDEPRGLAKEAFLDIVSFFEGQTMNYFISRREYLGYPLEKIFECLDLSLIKFGKNHVLIIHDLLTQMGQEIAKQTRLWHTEDIVTALTEKTGPSAIRLDAVRGILLKFPSLESERLCYDAFSLMKTLQLLEINVPEGLIWSNLWNEFIKLKWWGDSQKFLLSNELRILSWDQYPLEFLPPSFQPANLVELLKLGRSCLKKLWAENKEFQKLKYIDLHSSKELTEIPDLSEIPNLEVLDLSSCTKLSSVHQSVGFLQQLRELLLRNCFRLEGLPDTLSMPSLKSLDLCGCSRLRKFPGGVHNLTSLRTLNLNKTAIEILPTWFNTSLPSLKDLFISGRYFPEEVTYDDFSGSIKVPDSRYRPSGLLTDARSVSVCDWSSGLSFLEKLDLSYRNLDGEALPSCFGFPSSLKYLNLSGNKFESVPDGVHRLSKLRVLYLNNCVDLKSLPRLPLGLRYLDLGNCPLLETSYKDFPAWSSDKKLRPCDWMAAYLGYNGESYSYLNLHPRSTVWNNEHRHSVRWLAWGPSLEDEIPGWFNLRNKSFSRGNPTRLDLREEEQSSNIILKEAVGYLESDTDFEEFDSDDEDNLKETEGYGLFIVYEVPNPDAELSFDCWLQIGEDGPGVHLRFFAHERSPIGLNGVWMYIPSRWLEEDLVRLGKKLASIEITSQTVEVKECGARVVRGGEISDFREIVVSLCPHGLDKESLRGHLLRSSFSSIDVYGPVKQPIVPVDPSSETSDFLVM